MRIAVTGTPGTGKTTVAQKLQMKGYHVVSLNQLAWEQGFTGEKDPQRDTILVDEDAIDAYIVQTFSSDDLVFFEGHYSHLLSSIDRVVLLRCHPQVLQKRLHQKGWTQAKIKENVDAEALDVILCEVVEHHPPLKIFEIDTTSRTIQQITDSIEELISQGFQPVLKYKIGQMDWSEEILKD
jgi:adenylate kinase